MIPLGNVHHSERLQSRLYARQRRALEVAITALIDLLDEADGDPDLEDGGDDEETADREADERLRAA